MPPSFQGSCEAGALALLMTHGTLDRFWIPYVGERPLSQLAAPHSYRVSDDGRHFHLAVPLLAAGLAYEVGGGAGGWGGARAVWKEDGKCSGGGCSSPGREQEKRLPDTYSQLGTATCSRRSPNTRAAQTAMGELSVSKLSCPGMELFLRNLSRKSQSQSFPPDFSILGMEQQHFLEFKMTHFFLA